MSGYTCHAHPPQLGGRPCGHVNKNQKRGGPHNLVCCEKCGCTKIASDARRKK